MNHDPRGQLAEALRESSDVAQRAYDHAAEVLRQTREAMEVAGRELDRAMEEVAKIDHSEDVRKVLRAQRTELKRWLVAGHHAHARELEARRASLQEFKVALFGRTMAGKSTLMEILTEGDGASIGKGQQRTTRDVRRYHWRGMQISDVPGVAAFGGEADEQLAMEEATQSDLVLFLFTDDAPQEREVDFYVQLRRMGKPIICLFNLKTDLDSKVGWMKFQKKKTLGFDDAREEAFQVQLNAMVKAKLPTEQLSFIPVHLLARFKAMDPQVEDRDLLREQSRFGEVEVKITEVVRERGAFFRRKSFVDGAVTHTYEMSHKLLCDARNQRIHKERLDKGLDELVDLIRRYNNSLKHRVQHVLDEAFSKIDIHAFAGRYLENELVKEEWERYLKVMGLHESVQWGIEAFIDEFREGAQVIAKEFNANISKDGVFSVTGDITHAEITDDKATFAMIGSIAGAVGTVALVLSPVSIPLFATVGISAALGGLGTMLGGFFDSEEEQRVKKTKELVEQLQQNVDAIKKKWKCGIMGRLRRSFDEISVSVKQQRGALNNIGRVIDQQRSLAQDIVAAQRTMNEMLMTHALAQTGMEGVFQVGGRVLRNPGSLVAFLVEGTWQALDKDTSGLRALTGEHTMVLMPSGRGDEIVSAVLGCPVEIRDSEIQLLSPPSAEVKARVRLMEEWWNVLVVHDGEVIEG